MSDEDSELPVPAGFKRIAFDSKAAKREAKKNTESWASGDYVRDFLEIAEIWQKLMFDPFYGHPHSGRLKEINKKLWCHPFSMGNPVPQWLRGCPQQEFVHLLVAQCGLYIYRSGEEGPFWWHEGGKAYRDIWLGLEEYLIARAELAKVLTRKKLPLPAFWFPPKSVPIEIVERQRAIRALQKQRDEVANKIKAERQKVADLKLIYAQQLKSERNKKRIEREEKRKIKPRCATDTQGK